MKGWKSIVIELFCNQHSAKRVTHAAEGERERTMQDKEKDKKKGTHIVTADSVAACVFKRLRGLIRSLET